MGPEVSQISRSDAPLLTADEEYALLARARGGDREARSELVTRNMGLVFSVALAYRRPPGFSLDDLIGHGVAGLLRGIDRYDPDRRAEDGQPFRLLTYAAHWVRQSIGRALETAGATIRIPVHIRREMTLARREGRDVPAYMKVRAHSDFAPAEDGPTATATAPDHREPAPIEGAILAESRQRLASLMRYLDGRHAEVIRLRFGLDGGGPRTLEEVGERLGLTKQRISQMEDKALARLRRAAGVASPDAPEAGPRRRATSVRTRTRTTPEKEEGPMMARETPATTAPDDGPARQPRALSDDDKGYLRELASRHVGESPARLADQFSRERGWRPLPVAVARVIAAGNGPSGARPRQATERRDDTTSRKSGYAGVYWHAPSKRWQAIASIDGKSKTLGYFDDPAEASLAYQRARAEHPDRRGRWARPKAPGAPEADDPAEAMIPEAVANPVPAPVPPAADPEPSRPPATAPPKPAPPPPPRHPSIASARAELDALRAILDAIEPLGPDAARRALEWAAGVVAGPITEGRI